MKCVSRISHVFLMFILVSCASFYTPKPTYLLKIQGQKGQIEHSSIQIHREISYYEKEELSHRSVRKVKVRIKSEIENVESSGFWIKNTTVEKEGQENLHGFGFPELKETIQLQLNAQGKVLKVEGHKKDSVFYLPPIILPPYPIKKGNQWSESFSWRNEEGQLFKTTFISEFLKTDTWKGKEIIKIKLTADTQWQDNPKDFVFFSRSEGYYLWDIHRGNVVYSESQARDTLESALKNSKVITKTLFTSETD